MSYSFAYRFSFCLSLFLISSLLHSLSTFSLFFPSVSFPSILPPPKFPLSPPSLSLSPLFLLPSFSLAPLLSYPFHPTVTLSLCHTSLPSSQTPYTAVIMVNNSTSILDSMVERLSFNRALPKRRAKRVILNNCANKLERIIVLLVLKLLFDKKND